MAYSDLIISEYIEGSSNNKAIEIYNGTGAAINLATAGYSLQMFFNGNPVSTLTINLVGTVAAGDVFVIANSLANATILAQADQTNGSGWFNGDDAVVLRRGTTVLDVFGQIGFDPGSEWGSGLISSADNTLRRKDSVTSGDAVGSDPFDPSMQWNGFAADTFSDLGSYTPAVIDTTLVSVMAVDASASEPGADAGVFRITRSGPLTDALTVAFALGGTADFGADYSAAPGVAVIAAGASFVDVTITPVDDIVVEPDESVVLTLADATDYDLGAPATAALTLFDNDSPPTLIHDIQGSGSASPLAGQTVTVEAIVVGDFQGSGGLQGFYVQEEDDQADGNASTSEGLFIFQGSSGTPVNVGDKVLVTGRVLEFASTLSRLTQLESVSSVITLSSGNTLPAATALTFPLATAQALEALEGMRVSIQSTLTVTDTFTLGRYGEVLLSSDGPGNQPGTDARLDQYTQFNAPDVAGNAAYQDLIAARRLVLDDGNRLQNQDPIVYGRGGLPLSADNTLRGGDAVSNLVGIIDDRFGDASTGNYRLQPTAPVSFDAVNQRTASAEVEGRIKVAAFNVLNFFNGDGQGGGFPTARGATNAAELERQRDKLVSAIVGMEADVIGLIELENDGNTDLPAIQSLVDAVNAALGGEVYAAIDLGGKLGTDEITVGFIYKLGSVTPSGNFAVLVDPSLPRPSLAQTFRDDATGALFTPVINHFKSKGSPDGATGGNVDSGDGQGAWNAQRTTAAERLADWLATDPTKQRDGDYIVLGDLNAYAMEDPLVALRKGADGSAGTADDFNDLLGADSYSYSFDGQWGSLDHALGSSSLQHQVVDAAKWHINADEPTVLDYNFEFKPVLQHTTLYAPSPFRSSDHDPVIVGLNPGLVIEGGKSSDRLIGTIGNDILRGGGAHDVLTGGEGDDTFVFDSLRDAHDTVTDFEPGHDLLDISALLAAVGYTGNDPVADGYLYTRVPAAANPGRGSAPGHTQTLVYFDSNGSEVPGGQQLIAQLTGVVVSDASVLLDLGG